jgi:tetrahydromethanopterin S-methyltransferase subunit F
MTSYQHLKHPFAVTVFEDQVYWTDWEAESIFKVNKFANVKGRSTVKNVAMQLYSPMDIHVYHRLKQPIATNACENSGCSHICLPRPKRSGSFTCACPDHEEAVYRLATNQKTCVIVPLPKNSDDAAIKDNTTASTEPLRQARVSAGSVGQKTVGHIAGAVVAVLLILALVLILVSVIAYRCYIRKTVRTLNFDNPVYRKTTEDQVSLEKNQYQPSRALPPTLEPLTAGQTEYV